MQNDEQEIRQLAATWMAATKSGNVKAVLELMSDDVVFLLPGQPPMIGKSAFAAVNEAQASHGPVQFDGTSEIQEIKVVGEWAFMWTQLTVTITPRGGDAPMTHAGHTLSILKKQNGKWLLARDANLLAPVRKSESGHAWARAKRDENLFLDVYSPLAWFTHHRNNRRRIGDLNRPESLKSVPLV